MMAEIQAVGQILGSWSNNRADLERVLQGLRDGLAAENGSGIETSAT